MSFRILGTGSRLADKVVTNDDLAKIMDTSDEWISTRTGIRQRHVSTSETASDLAAAAAAAALADSGCAAEEIDCVLCATLRGDTYTPAVACAVAEKLGIHAPAYDVNAACTGMLYCFDIADAYIAAGKYSTVLVVTVEQMSKLIDWTDRASCVLFGDGAGAAVIQAADAMYGSYLGADGKGAPLIFSKNELKKTPFGREDMEENDITRNPTAPHNIYMDGKETYKFSTKAMPQCIEEACKAANFPAAELDWIIPHQANYRIVQTAMKNLGLPLERAYVNIDHVGNTSSASVPIALDELNRSGKLMRGQKIGIVGFGAGLVYAGAIFNW